MVLGLVAHSDKDNIMANQYRFLPDFSVFENDEQNDVSTEDTNSSIMSRNRQVDTGTGEDFLERFYQNLRGAFKDDDKFKQTFMSKGRPKPDISELRSYVDKVKGSSGIEDALLEATGMYNPGMASDDNSMTIKDASDGITVPKQPDVMVDELSSGLGSYLRNRANKGSSFVGEGVQMASAGSLSVEDMDLARMLAGQTMRKEAADMGLPVVDMEEEAKKSAVEAARERAKKGITQSKGAPQGLMSPVASDPRVDTAASGLNEDDPLGRVRPKARPEVATAEVEPLTDDDMGLPTRSVPEYNFMLPGSEFRKALKEKEAESYSTIYGNSEKKDTPFKGVDVTKMTTGQVLDFVKLNGPFHKYNKSKYNQNTTAIGKYQFVGATLRDLKKRGVFKKLGIDENTLFDEDTQDKLSAYQAIHRIKDRSKGTFSSARKEMRNEWEGFKKVDDSKLDTIIKEIANEIGVEIIKAPSSDLAPKTSLRPKARPDTRVASN